MAEGGVRMALDLLDVSMVMFRQRLRNDRPGISETEIDAEIAAWLQKRPGAEDGDMPGVLSDRLS